MSIFSNDKKASERPDPPETVKSEFNSRIKTIQTVLQTHKAIFFNLFVLVSGLLTPDHYGRLGPMIWDDLMTDLHAMTIIPVSFHSRVFLHWTDKFSAMLPSNAVCGKDTRAVHCLSRR